MYSADYRCFAGYSLLALKKYNVLFLEATWSSGYKYTKNPGYDGEAKEDLSEDYLPGDIIKTSDLKVNDRKGYYQKGWMDSDGNLYSLEDYIEFPKKDFEITAVWEKIEFYIYYHSGFDSDIYTPILSDGYTKLCYDKSKFSWIEVEGYTFLGWVEEDTMGGGWTVDPNRVITQEKDDYRELKSDLHVYACYKEIAAPTDGSVMVIYNPQGGEGGPGIEYFFPDKESYYISDLKPTREGYDFLGWTMYDKDRVEFTAKEKLDEDDYEENIVHLFAVWMPQTTNYKKLELQARYGTEIMRDYYFETEYSSPGWQKINDHSYFVIKTTNAGQSENFKCMVSDVLIVEYNYGTWNLYGDAAGFSIRHQVEYDILTHNSNFKGRFLKAIADVGFFAASKIPGAGTMLRVLDFGGALLNFASTLQRTDGAEFAKKLTSETLNIMYDNLKKAGYEPSFIDGVLLKLGPELTKWAIKGISTEKNDLIDLVKDLGKASITTGKYIDGAAVQEKFVKFGTRFNELIVKIAGENANQLDLGGINIASVLEKIPFDFLGCIWSMTWDQVKFSINSKNLDPFGEFDLALQTYQKEITKHGFSQDIADAFPGVINDIFLDYYIQ